VSLVVVGLVLQQLHKDLLEHNYQTEQLDCGIGSLMVAVVEVD
jgi:hypothetical protein